MVESAAAILTDSQTAALYGVFYCQSALKISPDMLTRVISYLSFAEVFELLTLSKLTANKITDNALLAK
jgi:hypothetical protein